MSEEERRKERAPHDETNILKKKGFC